MIDSTGERLVPELQRDQLVHAEHLARYRFAAQFAEGRRVLDAASGEGYGTAILSQAGATMVLGIDNDPQAVDHATIKYASHAGLEFQTADAGSLPFENSSFDMVVSFETIEHVPDPESALSEFKRVLDDDGFLVISTPNASKYLADNEFHFKEFTTSEFATLLGDYFADVTFLCQQNWLTSAVLAPEQAAADDPETTLALEFSKTAGHQPGQELYVVAICGHQPSSFTEVAVATSIYEAHEMSRLYRAWIERAREAERLVQAWLERSREAERQVEEARRTISQIESSLSWKVTRPLRGLKRLSRRAS